MKEAREFIMKCVFILTACVSIAAVVLICIFMFANGIPAIAKIGPLNFLLGEKWKPMNNIFGILPMIVGSIYVTAGAIIIGVPIAFFASVYLAKFCNEKLYKILKPAVELMAGIPSIVYGFFGLVVIVPIMQKLMGGSGKSVLTASILLGIMILPTVIGVAESSIRVFRTPIMKEPWLLAPHGNEVCSLQYFREQSQEFLPVWFLVSVVPSARRWR